MLSSKAKYAINALLYLAKRYGEGPVLISDLAQKEHIPQKFLEQILLNLKNNGILLSKKGKGGGYYLIKPPEEVTIGQVIRCIDGPLDFVPCVSMTANSPCPECKNEEACGIRMVMSKARQSVSDVLEEANIASVLEWSERHHSLKTVMYYI